MNCCISVRKFLPCLLSFLAGMACMVAWPMVAQEKAEPPAVKKVALESPPHRGLDANLYMQISAEYRACCIQAYQLGLNRLNAYFRFQINGSIMDPGLGGNFTGTGGSGISGNSNGTTNPFGFGLNGPKSERPAAIIMDLDETVLDNGAFQSYELHNKLAYDQKKWDLFEERSGDDVKLITGAKEFIQYAQKMNVKIYYITNRNEKYKENTLKLLKRLQIGVPAEQLLCATKTSDKTDRRKLVEKDYNVILYFGDNLRDFDERFKMTVSNKNTDEEIKTAVEQRKMQVDKENRWGQSWIILPNPAYGEWAKVLGRGEKDLDLLPPSAKLD